MTETEKDEKIATQVRLRQQMEEQQQTLKDLFDWEDSIQKQQSQLQTNKSKSKEEMSVPERRNVDQSFKSNGSESAKINMSGTTKEGKTVNPLNEDDERNRGNAYYSKGNYDEAIRSYSRCISMNPSSTVAYSNRAMAYLKLKDWVRAEEDTTSALGIDPLHTKSYQRRSAARAALGKLRAALQDLNMAEMSATKTGVTSASKEISIEKQKLEKMLVEAMEKAPKRKVPIQFIPKQSKTSTDEKTMESKKPEPSIHQESDDGEMRAIQTTRKNVIRESMNNKKQEDDDFNTKEAPHSKDIDNKEESMQPLPNQSLDKELTPLPLPPKKFRTWYEFEQVWRFYSSNPMCRKHLLEKMKPEALTNLYKQNGMEDSNLFLELIQCVCTFEDHGMSFIIAISQIPKIDMVVMMLSKTERDLLRQLLQSTHVQCPDVWIRFGLS